MVERQAYALEQLVGSQGVLEVFGEYNAHKRQFSMWGLTGHLWLCADPAVLP